MNNTYILAFNAFAETTVWAIARFYVRLAHDYPQAARENYEQHIGAMDEGERAIFDRLIAIESMNWDETHEREGRPYADEGESELGS